MVNLHSAEVPARNRFQTLIALNICIIFILKNTLSLKNENIIFLFDEREITRMRINIIHMYIYLSVYNTRKETSGCKNEKIGSSAKVTGAVVRRNQISREEERCRERIRRGARESVAGVGEAKVEKRSIL